MLKHVIFILSCTLPPQSDVLNLVDNEMLSAAGWQRNQRPRDIVYSRSSDHATLCIVGFELEAQENATEFWNRWTMTSALLPKPVNAAPSGLKLGDDCRLNVAIGTSLKARVGRCFVWARVNYVGSGPRGNVTWHKADPEGDIEYVEGSARHAVARLKSRSYSTGPAITLNGRPISTTLRDESGRTFASLNGWALARNISLNINVRRGTLAFTHNGRDYVTALGTDQIKVGATWKSMGAMAVRKGNTWYVPLNGIESAIQ